MGSVDEHSPEQTKDGSLTPEQPLVTNSYPKDPSISRKLFADDEHDAAAPATPGLERSDQGIFANMASENPFATLAASASNASGGSLFGNSAAGAAASTSVMETPGASGADGAEEEDVEAEVVNIPGWTPSITLEVQDEVKTGEEDEVEIYTQRAKLLRFRDGDWKQRGLGNAKLLRNATTNQTRFILRQEKTEKVMANFMIVNHSPYCELALSPGSEKIWVLLATDYSEGTPLIEKLAIQFKDSTLAEAFRVAFDAAKHGGTGSTTASPHHTASPRAPEEYPLTPEIKVKPTSSIVESDVMVLPTTEDTNTGGDGHASSTKDTPEKYDLSPTKLAGSVSGLFSTQPADANIGESTSFTPGSGLFGNTASSSGNLFSTPQNGGGLFSTPANSGGTLFGTQPTTTTPTTGGLFGDTSKSSAFATLATGTTGSSLFASTGQSGANAPSGTNDSAAADANDDEDNVEAEVTVIPGWTPSVTLEVKDTVETGEENEEIVYTSQRTKLWRFRDGEWKERGIGIVKMLRNPGSLVARFLMRQENTGKIIANFRLVDEPKFCELIAAPNSENKWVWTAQDCSDEDDVRVEQFCLKLKDKDQAAEFKEAFDAARKNKDTSVATSKKLPSVPLFDSSNAAKTPPVEPVKTNGIASSLTMAAAATTSKLFSNSAPTSGIFSLAPSNGTTSGGLFSTGESAGLFSSAAPAATKEDEDAEADLEAEVTVIPGWTPSVTLDVKDKIETGEENEELLFCQRSKLFRFRDKEWKQRGLGLAKLLRNPSTNRVRFLMRQENTEKVVANCLLVAEPPYYQLTLAPNSDNKWIWLAQDCCDEEGTVTEKFCLKLKDKTIADEFYDAFEKAKRGEGTPLVDTGARNKTPTKTNPVAEESKAASPVVKKEGGLFNAEKSEGGLFGTGGSGSLFSNTGTLFGSNSGSGVNDQVKKNGTDTTPLGTKKGGSIFDTKPQSGGSIFSTNPNSSSIFDTTKNNGPASCLFATGANAIPLGTPAQADEEEEEEYEEEYEEEDVDEEYVDRYGQDDDDTYIDDPVAMQDFEGLWATLNEDGDQEDRARIENGYMHYFANPMLDRAVIKLRDQDTCEVSWPNGETWVGFLSNGALQWDDDEMWFKKADIERSQHMPSSSSPLQQQPNTFGCESEVMKNLMKIKNNPDYWKCVVCNCSWLKKILKCEACESPQPGVDPEQIKKEAEEAQKKAVASFLGTSSSPAPATTTTPFAPGFVFGASPATTASSFTFGTAAPAASSVQAKPSIFKTTAPSDPKPTAFGATPSNSIFSTTSSSDQKQLLGTLAGTSDSKAKASIFQSSPSAGMSSMTPVVEAKIGAPRQHVPVVRPESNIVVAAPKVAPLGTPFNAGTIASPIIRPPMYSVPGSAVSANPVHSVPIGKAPMTPMHSVGALTVDHVRPIVHQLMQDELQQRDMEIVQLSCHVDELLANKSSPFSVALQEEQQSQAARLQEVFKKLGEVNATAKSSQRSDENLMRRQESKFHQMEVRIDEIDRSVTEVRHLCAHAEMEDLRSTNRMLLAKVEALQQAVALSEAKAEKATAVSNDILERLQALEKNGPVERRMAGKMLSQRIGVLQQGGLSTKDEVNLLRRG